MFKKNLIPKNMFMLIVVVMSSFSIGAHALDCSLSSDTWSGGYVLNVTVTNGSTAAINGWQVSLVFNQSPAVTGSWNANVSGSGNVLTASNVGYNGNLSAGQSASFGVQGNYAGSYSDPICVIEGGPVPTPTPVTSTPSPNPTPSSMPTSTPVPTSTPSAGPTSNPTPSPEPASALRIQENTAGFCKVDGAVENDRSGFTGSGYANTDNAQGKAVAWAVSVPYSGSYSLQWRYANASSDNRLASVVVNGSNKATVDFNSTGAWTSWTTAGAVIDLQAGTNLIQLVAGMDSGLANIDYIELVGNDLSVGNCSGVSPVPTPTSGPTSTPIPVSTPTPNPGGSANSSMGGFANYAGYGLSTTTGGSGGRTVTASNYADLKSYVQSSEALTIRVSGTISASGEKMLRIGGSNKTIIGAGSGATIDGFGFNVSSWHDGLGAGDSCDEGEQGVTNPVSNIIIRNLRFSNSADDSVTVQCWSHHVWIDHNTFETAYDGSVDTKRGADLVTISYNHFRNTKKTSLVGHSDKNGRQDRGHLRVTYHHNWFDRSNNRTPRVRFGYVHVYNNYYDNQDSCMRIGPEGKIYAEANKVVDASKILRSTENEGSMTWTSSNVWDKSIFGDVGADLLDADQSVGRPPYSDSIGSAPSSPPNAGVGKI